MEKVTYKIVFLLFFITHLNFSASSNDEATIPTGPVTFEASYVFDNFNNLNGGIETGSCFLGMANMRLEFNVEEAGLWDGGIFSVNAVNTHGVSPTSELLGDMQVASNIDAGNHTFLQEAWFKQLFGNVELTIGLQDLNVEFANSEHGALFLNSSFGIIPVISGNFSAPIFPLSNLGFTAKWNISEKSTLLAALYDGTPMEFDNNPYNLKWQYYSGDGILYISEYQYSSTLNKKQGTYKAGVFFHNHIAEKQFSKDFPDSLNYYISGIYAYADQKIISSTNKSIDMFVQIGYSPSKDSFNDFYFGCGVNYYGLINKKGTDVLGFAVAHQHYNNNSFSETTLEFTYKYLMTESIFIQPDLQYIINPAGTGNPLENCLAFNFRLGIGIN